MYRTKILDMYQYLQYISKIKKINTNIVVETNGILLITVNEFSNIV